MCLWSKCNVSQVNGTFVWKVMMYTCALRLQGQVRRGEDPNSGGGSGGVHQTAAHHLLWRQRSSRWGAAKQNKQTEQELFVFNICHTWSNWSAPSQRCIMKRAWCCYYNSPSTKWSWNICRVLIELFKCPNAETFSLINLLRATIDFIHCSGWKVIPSLIT